MGTTDKVALILGTLHGQTDAIEWLQGDDWTVYACGHQRVGPGVEAADDFFLADITDVEAVKSLCIELGVDVVYSVGSDIAMPTVAKVSEELNLPTFHSSELIEVLHRKANLRAMLQEHGLNGIDFSVVAESDELSAFPRFPAIVKPSDSQGQRGISIVNDLSEAREALAVAQQFSSTKTAVIETFMQGPEVSVHVFVVDGSVEFLLASDRIIWDGPVVGFPAAHRVPADLSAELHGQIEDLIKRTVAVLEVDTGPLYFQMILTDEGPRIVEIAPRLDGCHLWRLVDQYAGVNLLARCFELLGGGSWRPVTEKPSPANHTLRFMLSSPDHPFDPASWPSADASSFVEFQLAAGDLPRSINDHVARVGYEILVDEVDASR